MIRNNNRCEKKFYISITEYYYIKQLVQAVMKPDSHMGDSGQYYVRSLYFDSVDNIDYYSKISGIEERKKLRLRIYDIADAVVKLEIKNRHGDYIEKESLVITKKDALSVINGDYSCLGIYSDSVATKAHNIMTGQVYKPKVIVDYDREAYVYPEHNVRVTFDKYIRGTFSDRLFDGNIGMVPVIREPILVMEVKYDRVFPEFIKQAISSAIIQHSAISKYCMVRETLV